MWFSKTFTELASHVAHATGKPITFLLCVLTIIVWAASGPYFGFSDTWQLIINTGTTIITFLMVFLIQNTQNRDAIGLHLKLDELIKATRGARNRMIDLDALSDEQLKELEEEYKRICARGDGNTGRLRAILNEKEDRADEREEPARR